MPKSTFRLARLDRSCSSNYISRGGIALVVLGALFIIGGIAATFSIISDAFENELWMGLMCLIFWPYLLWYAFTEYDHERKWLMIGLWAFGLSIGMVLVSYGRMVS